MLPDSLTRAASALAAMMMLALAPGVARAANAASAAEVTLFAWTDVPGLEVVIRPAAGGAAGWSCPLVGPRPGTGAAFDGPATCPAMAALPAGAHRVEVFATAPRRLVEARPFHASGKEWALIVAYRGPADGLMVVALDPAPPGVTLVPERPEREARKAAVRGDPRYRLRNGSPGPLHGAGPRGTFVGVLERWDGARWVRRVRPGMDGLPGRTEDPAPALGPGESVETLEGAVGLPGGLHPPHPALGPGHYRFVVPFSTERVQWSSPGIVRLRAVAARFVIDPGPR